MKNLIILLLILPFTICAQHQYSLDLISNIGFAKENSWSNSYHAPPAILGQKLMATYNFGFNLNYQIQDKWWLKTGVRTQRLGQILILSGRLSPLPWYGGPPESYENRISYVYLEFPLMIRHTVLEKSNFEVFVESGFSLAHYLVTEDFTRSDNSFSANKNFINEQSTYRNINGLGNLAIGSNYHFNQKMSLFAQLFGQYQLLSMEADKTFNRRLLFMGLEFGLRMNFSK